NGRVRRGGQDSERRRGRSETAAAGNGPAANLPHLLRRSLGRARASLAQHSHSEHLLNGIAERAIASHIAFLVRIRFVGKHAWNARKSSAFSPHSLSPCRSRC